MDMTDGSYTEFLANETSSTRLENHPEIHSTQAGSPPALESHLLEEKELVQRHAVSILLALFRLFM